MRKIGIRDLKASLLLPRDEVVFATWDVRQREGATAAQLPVVPGRLP